MSPVNALAYPGPIKLGDKGEAVERLQGWLCLHGYQCAVDGDFGPETLAALQNFHGWPHIATLGEPAWAKLTAPLARAMAPPVESHALSSDAKKRILALGDVVSICARQWTTQSVGGGPLRELKGNGGPVVEACNGWLAKRDRLPCECGHKAHGGLCTKVSGPTTLCACQGYRPDWRLAWCAGWVSTVLRQACESLGLDIPIAGSLNCDVLARQADSADLLWWQVRPGLWRGGPTYSPAPHAFVHPGAVFLVRAEHFDPAKPDWTHCGVVLEVLPPGYHGAAPDDPRIMRLEHGGIRTAEGNTNKDGGREGRELLERVRQLSGLDFICWRGA